MKKILGLDLGTNSIGWALVEIDHDRKIVKILGLGSRILSMDAAEISKFESGSKLPSTAAQRTGKRTLRKLNERFLLRRDRLHCVLNLLDTLPEHYKLDIEFENEKGKRSGKFKKGTKVKFAYFKDEKGINQFLFMDAYKLMEADFKQIHPELFYEKKNGKNTHIPFDWTLYYLRHKALTDPNFQLTKEQLAWITLSFNQKRGYEKVIGQDEKMQKEGEIIDTFVGRVKSIKNAEGKDIYDIVLSDSNNEAIELFRYKEETKIPITEVGDLKEIERVSKYNDAGEIDSTKTEYIINEIRNLLITNVKNTGQKRKENFVFEIELETGWIKEQQSRFTPKWKDTRRDFIIKTKYDEKGDRILKGADKGRNIGIPKEEDWTLMKLKTETSITNFNAKNGTAGVASFIYYNLLQNPHQKIKGDLVTVIERDYYRDELERIYKNQERFHPELRQENKELYEQAIKLLYPNNINHQKTIRELDFNYLIREDILMYQRELKSKKSLISDCVYEKENYEHIDKRTGEKFKKPLKAIHKFNPLFQEFRLWQFIKRLRIIKLIDIENKETKINIDVTSRYLKALETKERLYEYLNDKDCVTEKNVLSFLAKEYRDKSINLENYKWNFTSEKEPCNTTRYEFILRTKRINGFDFKTFLSPENEYYLWHFFYSIKKRSKNNQELVSLLTKLLNKSGLPIDFLPELVKNFSTFGGFSNDYGTYSEKAIKKLLPFLRVGKYWVSKDVENNLKKDLTDKIRGKVIDKESINGEIKDFQGLWISSACYLVYGRYSEVGEVQHWESPYDIENYLRNEFKQHSLNNPVVEKVLIETLHLVKDIWKFFGETIAVDEKGNAVYAKLFDKIHIELGREMKKNNKQKEKEDIQNKEKRKANERIIELLKELKKENLALEVKSPFQQEKLRILEEGLLSSIEYHKDSTEYTNTATVSDRYPFFKISKKEIKEITTKDVTRISRSDFERYKLWLDQRFQSPYSGKFIKLSDLFDRKKYEIEHVFPQERITLNALSNKVICESEINKEKKANTGYGFILNSNEREIFCNAHNAKVKMLSAEEYEQLVNRNFVGKKREILLSREIPEDFTNSQMANMQYITKVAMKLLSNIVREKDEDTYRSKHVLATNGTITTTLKKHWKINEVWSELTAPRYKRLNELTKTNLFGDYRDINGRKVFLNDVPDEIKKNFDPKRIDHRHHAMDALVIALITEEHVQYLNNISSQEENDEEKLKTRKGLKYLLTNSRKGINDEKEWYFLPPAQFKTAEGIVEFQYLFKEIKSKVFKDIVKEALESTVASFKQKNRIIRQRWNKYLKPNEDGQILIYNEGNLESRLKYNVRQPLHLDTFYGQVKLQNTVNKSSNVIEKDISVAIKGGYELYETGIRERVEYLRYEKKSNEEIIRLLNNEFSKVKVYAKLVASRFGNELTSLASSEKIYETIESITDTGIQKILVNHLEDYKGRIDGEGKGIAPQTLAFSHDGITELNQNIKLLNNGKFHKPIYKVRIAEAMGTKFQISEEGTNSSKYVATAGGSNAFCSIYLKGNERKFYVPTLRESIINLKDGFEPCPSVHPLDSDYKLFCVLNPNDLVYVPTEDEVEYISSTQTIKLLADFSKLTKEKLMRIYKFTDGSGTTMNFVPVNIASVLFNLSKKEQDKIGMNLPIQNELGVGSPQSKNQNSLDGVQIKSVCWKIKIDRLGNITS
jgi:CRISPR-associated endonuclease Csn1